MSQTQTNATAEVMEAEAVGSAVQFLNGYKSKFPPTLQAVAFVAGMADRPFAFWCAFVRATQLEPSVYWRKVHAPRAV